MNVIFSTLGRDRVKETLPAPADIPCKSVIDSEKILTKEIN